MLPACTKAKGWPLPLVLGSLYKGLNDFVVNKITNNVSGPFWLFQAWLIAYFPFSKGSAKPLFEGGDPQFYDEYFLGFRSLSFDTFLDRKSFV